MTASRNLLVGTGAIIVATLAVIFLNYPVETRFRTGSSETAISPTGRITNGNRKRGDGIGTRATKVGIPVLDRNGIGIGGTPVPMAALDLSIFTNPRMTVEERVLAVQQMRGYALSRTDREAALSFLSGENWPENLTGSSAHWLADETLTALRLQEPPQDDLAEELAKVAFQPGTDPVVRDYIMQHLGHLWEQYGSRKGIEHALWRAVASSDETTPGTALIALSRGYERDQQEKSLAKVRQQAFELAGNPNTGLAVRVTSLSIAGDGGGKEVKELAAGLVKNPDTPVILKKVAERVRQ